MTDIAFVTVANSISKLRVSGIKFVDLSGIPENAATLCPVFVPRPDNFLTEMVFTFQSFGTGGIAKMDLDYVMNWQYFHAPIGSGGGLFSVYQNMIENLAAILEKIADNDTITGAVQIKIRNIPNIAKIADAAGNLYHGVDVALEVKEFING